MIFRVCCCCFGFGQKSNDAKRLLTKGTTSSTTSAPVEEVYTVHKISSFGRGVSHDDDAGAHSDYEMATSSNDRSHIVLNKNHAMWSSKAGLAETAEYGSDFEDTWSKSPQASPMVKKKGHWGKVLMKTKRETATAPTKQPQSFQSLASVSMMMLPTITVAGSSPALADNSEDSSRIDLTNSSLKTDRQAKSLSSSPQTSSTWLKSQSMLNVNCIPDEMDAAAAERPNDEVARKYGLDTSLYNTLHLSKSSEAINQAWKSMEDFANDKGFVDLPNGTVHFCASYDKTTKKLLVRFVKIEGLAPKGTNRARYNCVLKLTLLPHEKHIKFSKSIPAHSTLDIDESFIFSVKDPTKKVLRISVFDSECLGKYDAVGHALFYLEDVLNSEQKSHVMKLYRQSIPDVQAGSIKITLHYHKDSEFMNIFINEAYNLPIFSSKCKSYMKITQHYRGRKIKEIYSPYVAAAQEVRFNFKIDLKVESNATLCTFVVISVKMRGFFKKDVLIGRIIFGPFLYAEYGKSLTPWGRALLHYEPVSHVYRMYL
ncbi:uncharacterized protein LOC135844647 [Planococcus citri]|uniref:uncharacterized protein LOC135844647 n=1 Tax=Planococcus citri TaxID=170843 RepID=UPI0031F746E8